MINLEKLSLLVAIACAFAHASEIRTWTGINGNTLQAELLNKSGEEITLRTKDGQIIQTRLTSLSVIDQDYLEGRAAQQRAEAISIRREDETIVSRSASSAERTVPSTPEGSSDRAPDPPSTTLAPAKPTHSEPPSGVWKFVAMLIGVIVFFRFVSKSRHLKRKRRMIKEADAYLSAIKSKNQLQPIMTSLMLKKGEQAYLEAPCSLNETRSIRHNQRGGVGFRVAKGVYIGGSKGTSHSVPQMTRIDSGKLILTNKRLVFDGSQQNRNIALNKIASLNQFIDAFEVISETRQKSMFFTVPNSLLWTTIIRILSSVDDPDDISGDTIDIQFT